jgi:hypothetical protein
VPIRHHTQNKIAQKDKIKFQDKLIFGEKPDYKRLHPFYCPGLYYVHKEERSNTSFPDYKAKSCYFLGYHEESPMSFVVKDTKTGKVLVKDSCVFDPDLNKFSKDVLIATDDDAEDEIKDDDQLVQIDDVPDPILSRLQDLRISTQNKHEKTENLAAEKSLITQEILSKLSLYLIP